MRTFASYASSALLGMCLLSPLVAPAAAPEHPKNWTPPATKIYAQKLADEIMATHPELISVTFHGVGKTEKDFFLASTRLRDDLMKKIPSYAALFRST
jgi:hypothetical protein